MSQFRILNYHSIVRAILAAGNALGLSQIRWAVQRRYGVGTAALFMILTCTQFHLPFWIGRTLPNMFALLPGIVLILNYWFLRNTQYQGHNSEPSHISTRLPRNNTYYRYATLPYYNMSYRCDGYYISL